MSASNEERPPDSGYDRLPGGPDWKDRLLRDLSGRRSYYSGPPNVIERFWPWPVGVILLAGLGSLEEVPPPVVFFAAGAGVVAFWNELRWSTARENHAALLREVRRLCDELGQDGR